MAKTMGSDGNIPVEQMGYYGEAMKYMFQQGQESCVGYVRLDLPVDPDHPDGLTQERTALIVMAFNPDDFSARNTETGMPIPMQHIPREQRARWGIKMLQLANEKAVAELTSGNSKYTWPPEPPKEDDDGV